MGPASTAPKPDLIQPGLDRLVDEIQDLKRRVSALETRLGGEVVEPAAPPVAVVPILDIEAPAGAVVLLGKALLGIAGAYLLRALTDAAILPRGVGLLAGVAYAGVWLYLAARNAPERKFVAVLDALTSALIVGPLLWEATMRFQAVSSWGAAGIILTFAVSGLVLSWRTHTTLVARIATAASAVIAMTLLIASRDLLPFTLVLLVLGVMVEFAACSDFRITERWLVAVLADLAVLLLAYIVTRKGGTPEGYAPLSGQAVLAVQAALVAIYAVSAVALTFARTAGPTFFEIAQAAMALLVGFLGAVQIAGANPVIGLMALVAGAGCYAISFVVRGRNYFTYATFGLVLVFTGMCMVISGLALTAALSILAAACCWKGMGFHGAAYLLAASFLSGVAAQTLVELFGGSGAGGYGVFYVLLIPAALLCYMLLKSGGIETRIAALAIATDLTWLVAGAAALATTMLWPAVAPTARTAVLMGLSLALAWCGIRWRRTELVWLVYAFMALGAYKLLTQDFPQEHTLPLVVSLLLYGSTLMVLPRMLRSNGSGTASDLSRGDGSSLSR